MIKDTVPTANVKVLVFGYTVVLTGTVSKAEEVQVIMELARSQYPEFQMPGQPAPAPPPPGPGSPVGPTGYQGPLIVNAMRIGGVQQVALEVVVARVNRSELRQMTFNFLINHDSYYAGSIIRSPQVLTSLIGPAIAGSAANLAASSSLPFGFITDK